MVNIEQLLTPVRNTIVDKPPFTSGSLQLSASLFSLFYEVTKNNRATGGRINFINATPNEIEKLAQACEPATFGQNKQDVMDETYCKARKMDTDCFSTPLVPDHTDLIKIVRDYLLEGTDSTRKIKVELYKLNVYSKGSFFKSHVDTPRNENMFGSLVVTFPTPHEGGALLLRHRGQEWTFDSASVLAAAQPSSVAYAAFFSDIEHEVIPVTSGYRVTLTYSLFFDDHKRVSAKDFVPSAPQEENERMFRSAFEALLKNPKFLPYGGTLGFGLRHAYQVESTLEHVYNLLKGSDATVYQTVRALGFEPKLYLYYEELDNDDFAAILTESVPDPRDENAVEDTVGMLLAHGGICIWRGQEDGEVNWVTPLTKINRQECAYPAYRNNAYLSMAYRNAVYLSVAYGDVCLLVRIGEADERLAYQTAAEAREVSENRTQHFGDVARAWHATW